MTGTDLRADGFTARWRGIYDDKGRVMVAICHNMDLGDAVEHSDTPAIPRRIRRRRCGRTSITSSTR